jgi:hypothetical protein
MFDVMGKVVKSFARIGAHSGEMCIPEVRSGLHLRADWIGGEIHNSTSGYRLELSLLPLKFTHLTNEWPPVFFQRFFRPGVSVRALISLKVNSVEGDDTAPKRLRQP